MKVLAEFDVNQVNQQALGARVSIYSLLAENHLGYQTFLVGCGLWDRENQPHTRQVKDATPGIVLRVNETGEIINQSERLDNIVYPLIERPWCGDLDLFVGCRTGFAYWMDRELRAVPFLRFDQGIYGVECSNQHKAILIGTRNGSLFRLDDQSWSQIFTKVAQDRLWNLCLDKDDQLVWSSCYNGRLYLIDFFSGQVIFDQHLGAGATTLVTWLPNETLAVGCMGKKICLLRYRKVIQVIDVEDPVCFIADLPDKGLFYATGYRGQIWVFDYQGRLVDQFTLDSRENNPIWIGQTLGPNQVVLAWANGMIRVIQT